MRHLFKSDGRQTAVIIIGEHTDIGGGEFQNIRHRSADLMLMLVVGGTGWLYGGVVGAIVFKLMQNLLSSIPPQYWTFWLGLFLVVLVLVGRDRLLKPWTWIRR